MLGKRKAQRHLFHAAPVLGPEVVDQMGVYGKLAKEGHKIFRDESFAQLYCPDNGRPSTPPSMLAIAHLLQHHDRVSDAEVIERTRFDLRWKVALDLDPLSVKAPFAKSTFQAFRARLTLHQKEGLAFETSVKVAAQAGLLPEKLLVGLDSSPVRGRGAVKDTYNLLSDAIRCVVVKIAKESQQKADEIAREHGLQRHLQAPSLKGSEVVDWTDADSVTGFLRGLVEDCQQAVALAQTRDCASEEVALLRKVIDQDLHLDPPEKPTLSRQVAKDRTVSISDPEMRHGRKSSGQRYDGHKAHMAVDVTSGVITAVRVTAPASADGEQVKSLLEQTQATTGRKIKQALGDCAYSSRQALRQAEQVGVELITKMPSTNKRVFGPSDFQVREDLQEVRCPAGHLSVKTGRRGEGWVHSWSPKCCGPCPLKSLCTKAARRTFTVFPDFHDRRHRERYARSAAGRQMLRKRVIVEHRIGRIKQLGGALSRYFGAAKTEWQWLWAASMANLCLVWAVASHAGVS